MNVRVLASCFSDCCPGARELDVAPRQSEPMVPGTPRLGAGGGVEGGKASPSAVAADSPASPSTNWESAASLAACSCGGHGGEVGAVPAVPEPLRRRLNPGG
jgi:hypothetical protein